MHVVSFKIIIGMLAVFYLVISCFGVKPFPGYDYQNQGNSLYVTRMRNPLQKYPHATNQPTLATTAMESPLLKKPFCA